MFFRMLLYGWAENACMFDPRTETNKTTFFMHFVRSWFMLYRNNEIQEFNNMFVFVLLLCYFRHAMTLFWVCGGHLSRCAGHKMSAQGSDSFFDSPCCYLQGFFCGGWVFLVFLPKFNGGVILPWSCSTESMHDSGTTIGKTSHHLYILSLPGNIST
jgi:hypothetical protein